VRRRVRRLAQVAGQVFHRAGAIAVAYGDRRGEPHAGRIVRNPRHVFRDHVAGLVILLQPEFGQRLDKITLRQIRENRAEPVEKRVRGGEILLFDIFESTYVIRPEILRRDL
jgi:hypothetical protein